MTHAEPFGTPSGQGDQEPTRQPDIAAFERETGLRFTQPRLLIEALTHRSYVNEHPHYGAPDNQRLEFLGDAVIDLVVGEWLFLRHPDVDEGALTSTRAQIVRTETLARFARRIRLGEHLLLGKGEDATGGAERSANLCAGFEALAGALYLDRGLDAVREWLQPFLEAYEEVAGAEGGTRDAKSRLQESVQATLHVTPWYRIIREEGPDHAKVFTAQVLVNQEVWGEGEGSTKQAAEQAAAENALALHPGA